MRRFEIGIECTKYLVAWTKLAERLEDNATKSILPSSISPMKLSTLTLLISLPSISSVEHPISLVEMAYLNVIGLE